MRTCADEGGGCGGIGEDVLEGGRDERGVGSAALLQLPRICAVAGTQQGCEGHEEECASGHWNLHHSIPDRGSELCFEAHGVLQARLYGS